MIQCKHRWPYFVTNRGLQTWFCDLHRASVNDDICSSCSDREGETRKDAVVFEDYPKRSDEEIMVIYKVCQGCLLLDDNKKCQAMFPEFHPTDIVAQHPSNHCPEQKW